jgi:vitamin B12 transporter
LKFVKSILPVILFLINTFVLIAQNDTVYINEVEIKGNKPTAFRMEGNRVVQIIGREQISEMPVRSLNDLLEYAVNADVRQRGADEVQADVSLRGGSAEQTLILLNGIRVNDPQTGHFNLDLPVELSQVERIEILEGSGARQYGAGAFCGVINIVTNKPDKSFLKVGLRGGMHGLFDAVVSGNISGQKTSSFISFSTKTCDGYIKNTDYDIWKGYFSTNHYSRAGTLSFQVGYSDKAFGANSFYSAKYPDQFEHTKTLITSLQFTSSGKIKIIPGIYGRKHHDRFELFRYEAPSWYKSHNYHMTNILGASLNVLFNSASWKTGIKAEYFREMIYSNVLGTALNDTISDEMDKSGFFTKSATRNNISLSAESQFNEDKFSFSYGLLLNYNDVFGFDFCPGLDLSYAFRPWIKWYFSANKSFRQPTFTDLYYVGPTNKGNPDLKPEKAYTFETGFKLMHKGFAGHISGFYRKGLNIIDWVRQPDSLLWQSENITELQTWGLETSAQIDFNGFNVKNSPFRSIVLAYLYLNSYKNSGSYISYYVMDYLKHKLSLCLNFTIYKKIGGSLEFSWSDRNGTYTSFSDGMETAYKGFTTTDIKLFWRPLNFDIYLNCNNIFDTRHYDFGNIIMPGRWIFGGINYKFDFSKKTKKHE